MRLRANTAFYLLLGSQLLLKLLGTSVSSSLGVVELQLSGGTAEAPEFLILSASAQKPAIFRGYVESVSENNVTLEKTIDPINSANELSPLSFGVWGTIQARAVSTLDTNGSIQNINLVDQGERYGGEPLVWVDVPVDLNGSSDSQKNAYAKAEWNATTGIIESITVTDPGLGYLTPPNVYIDGGPAFLRIIENESNFSGLFFEIISNTGDTLELNASLVENLSSKMPAGTLVELVPTYTVGSLLGTTSTQLHADENASKADWVYLLKRYNNQTGTAADYLPVYNDGLDWRSVNDPSNVYSDQIISPNSSMIIARRNEDNVTINLSGVAKFSSTYWELPETGKSKLVGNPYPTDVMLSDLIDNTWITEDNSSATSGCWLAHSNPELADNIQILNTSFWNTYWHDGTNIHVSEYAKVGARKGSGIGGALTRNDFSMSSGIIENISNEQDQHVIITSTGHGIKKGFSVTISNVLGRKTNENKNQVNALGIEVPDGDGLMVESSVNGQWEVLSTTTDTFVIATKNPNSDFYDDGNASWSIGTAGSGYDSNVSLSIIGGGGKGAKALGIVKNGKIDSISIISGGLLYKSAPTIIVHNGGWKNLTSGNAPINDVKIESGSGILLIRNHPHGENCVIPIGKFLNQ